ncbi:hypothetical protein F4809DRAFT_615517 [Biscogniauxia mediterranea]|nr:hypothetical protein F4809DRAFT_615517 [Biscogniauxia mediterranea]
MKLEERTLRTWNKRVRGGSGGRLIYSIFETDLTPFSIGVFFSLLFCNYCIYVFVLPCHLISIYLLYLPYLG